MHRYRGRSGININLLYQLLIQVVPKKVAVLIIALMIGIPLLLFLLLYLSPFILNLILMPDGVNNNLKTVQKQLNKAARIANKEFLYNTFDSNGLAQYFEKGIENSTAQDNKLNTDFAQIEFYGDGICTSKHSCTAKFNNSTGQYTIYLINNGKGLIKTSGYSWKS